MLQKAYKN